MEELRTTNCTVSKIPRNFRTVNSTLGVKNGKEMRLTIATGIGLLIGLLMLLPSVNRNASQWISSRPSIDRTYQVVNYPAIVTVFGWGHLGLPHPSGEWGELKLLPGAIALQWLLLGALAGLILRLKKKRKHTQPQPAP